MFFSYGRNYCMDHEQCLDDSPIFIMMTFHSHVSWTEVMSQGLFLFEFCSVSCLFQLFRSYCGSFCLQHVGTISKEQSRQTG